MEKLLKNTEENKHYNLNVVTAFYEKAVIDVLIGYHFRKIATTHGHHPLKPPIEAFHDHLPRIAFFWRMQLLGEKMNSEDQEPYDLISIHRALSIRKGEVGRWILLFKETLNEAPEHELKKNWSEKIDHFEKIFMKVLF